jgi:O-antigen ligase
MIVWTAVATVALVFVTPHSVWKRLGTISDVTTEEGASAAADEGSARQRMEIWKVAATIFAEHPITGVGVGAYSKAHNVTALRPVFDPTARGSRDAHSTYLSMGAETGLPGLLLFLAVIGTAVFDAERTRRRGKATHLASTLQLYYLEVGLLGYLIAGIWGSYGQLVLTYLHVAVISAAATILNAELSPLDMTRRGRRAQPGMALLPAAVRRGMR